MKIYDSTGIERRSDVLPDVGLVDPDGNTIIPMSEDTGRKLVERLDQLIDLFRRANNVL